MTGDLHVAALGGADRGGVSSMAMTSSQEADHEP